MPGSKSLSGSPAELDELAVIEPVCAVFRRTLKGAGLKYTLERAQILDSVMRQPGLFHADELIKGLKAEGFRVSKATVYRTLKLMQDSGIIQRVLFDDDDAGRYQVVFGTSGSDLLIRTDNGDAVQIEISELRGLCEKLCAERGLTLKAHRLQVFAAPN
ncbi:MAG: transcriptional repressor [Phycisphaeraceae bacterium]|nr:transcriptional repressor [Phycisphaeraceae bacterium]